MEQDRATDHAGLVRKRIHLWLPLGVTVGVLVLVGIIAPDGHLLSLSVTAVVSFFAAGKFVTPDGKTIKLDLTNTFINLIAWEDMDKRPPKEGQ